MKKWNKISALALSVLAMGACETEMMNYEGKPGVYFHVQAEPLSKFGDPSIWERVDTSKILFAKIVDDEIEVILPVQVMGYATNYDRYFEIKLVDTATTARVNMDYSALTLRNVIPADSSQGYVKFTLKRTPILMDTTFKITLDLVPTNDFELPMDKWRKLTSDYSQDRLINIVRHVITFNDGMYQPKSWAPAGGNSSSYWGIFSKKKMRLMLNVCEMLIEDFDKTMSSGLKSSIAVKVDLYLNSEKEAGRTVYEDELDKNGKPIEMKMGVNN